MKLSRDFSLTHTDTARQHALLIDAAIMHLGERHFYLPARFESWYAYCLQYPYDGISFAHSALSDLQHAAPQDHYLSGTIESCKIMRLSDNALTAWHAILQECRKSGMPKSYESDLDWDRYTIGMSNGASFIWVLRAHGTHLWTLDNPRLRDWIDAAFRNEETGTRVYLWRQSDQRLIRIPWHVAIDLSKR